MTDKWEMCWLTGDNDVFFASLGTALKKMSTKEYLKTKGMSESGVGKSIWILQRYDAYSCFLDDGWEPFAEGYFRRKYQG